MIASGWEHTGFDMRGWEYGGGGSITAVEGRDIALPSARIETSFKLADNRSLGWGYAVRYGKALIHDNKYKIVKPGAFKSSLQSGREVKVLLCHRNDQCLGSTNDGLELF